MNSLHSSFHSHSVTVVTPSTVVSIVTSNHSNPGQSTVSMFLPTDLSPYTSLLISTFVLTLIARLHFMYRSTSYDVFFIDWERPKGTAPKNAEKFFLKIVKRFSLGFFLLCFIKTLFQPQVNMSHPRSTTTRKVFYHP